VTGNLPPAGFEDRDDHRTACASESHAADFHGPERAYLFTRIRRMRYENIFGIGALSVSFGSVVRQFA